MIEENFIIDRIEELCVAQKMSRYALSQNSGINQASLSTLFKKRTMPTVHTLERICSAFGITLSQFFAKDGEVLELTDDQKEVLELWMHMSEREKELVMAYMQGISHK